MFVFRACTLWLCDRSAFLAMLSIIFVALVIQPCGLGALEPAEWSLLEKIVLVTLSIVFVALDVVCAL